MAGLALLTAGFASAQDATERVNISTADAATLARVPDGVGRKKPKPSSPTGRPTVDSTRPAP